MIFLQNTRIQGPHSMFDSRVYHRQYRKNNSMSARNLSFGERKAYFQKIAVNPRELNEERIDAARFLVEAEEAGEYVTGEMNSYAQQVLGIELRREFQGIYQAACLLRLIRKGKLAVSEDEIEAWKSTPIQWISGIVSKQPEKVAEALEIVHSKHDVTNRLKELRARKPAGR